MDEEPRRPRAPAYPLWEGIYTFPWRLSNFGVFLSLFIGLTLLALIACGFHALFAMLYSIDPNAEWGVAGSLVSRGSRMVFVALCILTVLLSLYPAAYFFRVVEFTGAGADEVKWEYEPWYECVGKLLLLIWLAGCSAALSAPVLLVARVASGVPPLVWWGLLLVQVLIFFPLILLSAMAANTPWVPINPPVLLRLGLKPQAAAVLYLDTLLFAVPCVLLGYWMIVGLNWWLAPLVGVFWATYWLSYARILGRVGWILSGDDQRRRKRKRRLTK
jgi:hypothetical protein